MSEELRELKENQIVDLTAIIPVSKMAGRFQNLEKWVYQEEVKDIQLIFVHDIQDNETNDELIRIVSKLSNAKVIEDRFGGPGTARNAGLDLVNAGWVTFWDSDDIPEVAEVRKMIKKASEFGQEIAVGGFNVKSINSEVEVASHLILNLGAGALFDQIGMNPGLWRWVFRKDAINKTRFMPFRMAEDQCFLFDLRLNVGDIYVHNKSVYTYFVGDSLQLTRNPKAISDLLKSVPYLLNSLRKADTSLRNFGALLVTRQAITALRRGSFLTKVRMTIQIVKLLPTIIIYKKAAFSRAFRLFVDERKPLANEK